MFESIIKKQKNKMLMLLSQPLKQTNKLLTTNSDSSTNKNKAINFFKQITKMNFISTKKAMQLQNKKKSNRKIY